MEDEFVSQRTVSFPEAPGMGPMCKVLEPVEPGFQAKFEIFLGRKLSVPEKQTAQAALLRCHRRDILHVLDQIQAGETPSAPSLTPRLEKGPRRKSRRE